MHIDSISKIDKYQEKVNITELIDPIQKAVMNKKSCIDQIKIAISTFSDRLIELIPNVFNSLSSFKNIDEIDDEINEKVEVFRELSNIILAESNIKEMNHAKFVDYLKSQNVSSLEAVGLTMQGLKVLKLLNNKIYNEQLIEGFSLLLKTLSIFDSLSLTIHTSSKSANDELRYENRVIARQLDSFITMIESSSKSTEMQQDEDESELIKSIRKMIEDLSSVLLQVSHITTCALIAVVPEMYNKFEKDIQPKLNSSYKSFSASVSKVKSIAVGPTLDEFSTAVSDLDSHFMKFVDYTKKIDFRATNNDCSFPQSNLIHEIESIGEITSKIYEILPNLTDVSIIEPDPEAAEQIRAKFEVPSVSSTISNLPPSEILASIKKSRKNLEKVLKNIKEKVFNETTSSSQSIVDGVKQIDDTCMSFVKLCKQMIASCQDQRLGELQTAIFTFTSIVTTFHESAKKRLLREVNFEAEIEESFSQFSPQIKTIVELSEEAVRKAEEIVQQQLMAKQLEASEGPSDEVTRELMATENAINEMSARLANFSSMLNNNATNEDEQLDDELDTNGEKRRELSTIQAEEGTFPAFVISKAVPALETTSLIMQRAQVMAKEFLKNGSNTTSERALIKLAQEISEAAQLLIIVAEILIKKTEKDAEFKAIAAAKIIKASVAAFVAKILQMGGDSEGKMNMYVKVVIKNADLVIEKGEKIANEKMAEIDNAKPKSAKNKFTEKLNIQSEITKLDSQLKQQENDLKQFNKKF